MKKESYRKTTTTVDHQTGEAIETETEIITRNPKEPDYVKMYIADMAGLHGLSKAASGVLFELLSVVNYQGIAYVPISKRKNMCKRIGIMPQTFSNQLQVLIKKTIIHRIEQGEYEINPKYFTRGNWAETKKRIKSIEVNIRYDITGRRIESKVK